MKSDTLHRRYKPLLDRTLKNALSRRISQQFPRIGGERIRGLCAEMVLEVVQEHIRSADVVQHGQCLWMGVSAQDPPARHKPIKETLLVPVILDLSTSDDIEDLLNRVPSEERLLRKSIRLCEQAYTQGALLSNADLSQILNRSDSAIATVLAEHERRTGKVVPRRATLHDMGSGVTHKRIICWKRYAEGKTADRVARETHHSLEAVDRYLGDFDRVRSCRRLGMDIDQIAFTLNHGRNLVLQYLEIDRELQGRDASPRRKKGD